MRDFSKVYLLLILATILPSCRNYENKAYIEEENRAIGELIPEMTDLYRMVKMNNLDLDSVKIVISSLLDTAVIQPIKPSGYTIAVDGVDLPEHEIEKNKERYNENMELYEAELDLFHTIYNGEMKPRRLEPDFYHQHLNTYIVQDIGGIEQQRVSGNILGYLHISRIHFNRAFDTGYLCYTFYCGVACCWTNNIEIKLVGGKWRITKTFSGGIA